ncbi:MAG TPA: helix-turn-helix transcriptional regulator [Solirubrobacteraceae bacterium]|jgi:DNA-binding transcriptional ArsR family regulator|nr:helix-turn-helix transcriptional regulator [Solirubrobacteraceae bacterium]
MSTNVTHTPTPADVSVPTADASVPTADASVPTSDAPEESLAHPAVEAIELAAVLHALSDPIRLKIVSGLSAGVPRTCKSFDLPVTKSTCTHHFKVLREAGVIRQRLEGTTRLSVLRRDDLEQRFPGLLDSILHAAA